jgi:multidrug efflux pump subunit AcrA (membrane-fusion protein)
MKMTRQPLILAASLAAVLALSACGKKDESAAPAPSATPPAAATAPAPAAPATSSTAPMAMNNAPATVTFSSVELGSTVDANNKILASGTSFAPKDSINASVDTSGSGNAALAVKWTYQDGQVVHEDSKTINAMGPQTTAFMISKPGGFPAGNYKVDISLNGNQVASKDFSVK